MIQRTLVLIKPEAVKRHLVGKILTRFEDAGLKIVGMKQVWIDENLGKKHYFDVAQRHGEKILKQLLEYISEGPVIAFVLEGSSAVENVRKIVGPTEPKSCPPGTISGDFAHGSYANFEAKQRAIRNIIHASGNPEEATQEISLWFKSEELHTYQTVSDLFM